MALKNKPMFIMLTIFTVVNILDAITAFFILPGEANPIFLFLGSIWPVILLKAGMIAFLILYYRRNIYASEFSIFMIMMVLVIGSLLIGLGVASNIYGMTHPQELAASADIPASEKAQTYFTFIGIIYLIPVLLSLLAFKLFQMVRKRSKIDIEYYKNRPWWKP